VRDALFAGVSKGGRQLAKESGMSNNSKRTDVLRVVPQLVLRAAFVSVIPIATAITPSIACVTAFEEDAGDGGCDSDGGDDGGDSGCASDVDGGSVDGGTVDGSADSGNDAR
jgi:hypothetical protein